MPKTFEIQAKYVSNKDGYDIYQIEKDNYDELNEIMKNVKDNLIKQEKLNEKFYVPFWKHGTDITFDNDLNDLVYTPKYYIKFYSQKSDTDKTNALQEKQNIKFNISFYESKTSMGLRAKLL